MFAPAHSSRESALEHFVEVATKSRRHRIFTHFPKGRNCDVCLRTKMTKALCRRHTGEALFRAEEYGELMAADHKVFSEGCESRDNHRYAAVVQDLATQWIQSYPCKTKSSHETEKSLSTLLDTSHRPKRNTQTTRWNLGEDVKIYHGIAAFQFFIDPRQMAQLKEPFDE